MFKKNLNPNGLVAFVDVGQGDSIFIKAPHAKETVLIDTGGKLAFSREKWRTRNQTPLSDYNLVPFLKSQGISTLDKLVITHADEDHMGEVLNLCKKIVIKELYLAKGVEKNPKMTRLLHELQTQGTLLHSITAGDQIGEEVKLFVLNPDEEVSGENDDSLVLWTEIKDTKFLFTGDLEKDGEQKLIQKYPELKIDVLKVGHHGSKTSSSKEFIRQISPRISIISCGKNNRYGHPHIEILKELDKSDIYRTDQSGMIYFQWSFFKDIQLRNVKKNQ